MQISFLRHASSLTFVLGGLGGMREDVRGVGKPLDTPKDPSADLGNFLPLFGTSQLGIHLLKVNTMITLKLVIFLFKLRLVYTHSLNFMNLLNTYVIQLRIG